MTENTKSSHSGVNSGYSASDDTNPAMLFMSIQNTLKGLKKET